jgi:hypothetical protein
MGNIIGEGFADYVRNQIVQREKIHGNVSRTNQQLSYLNSNTAYVKLISSVDIKSIDRFLDNKLKNEISKIGLGSNLAKKLVLFGGVYNADKNSLNSGISTDGSIINNSAYGFGGNEFGIVPMPGIESVSVESLNRGSLRKATVNITANNRLQFEMIETLYLRLGFTVLLEWGHTIYVDNGGKIQFLDNRNTFSLEDGFLAGKYDKDGLYKAIKEKREASYGNFDAIYAKVSNFSWEFTDTGKYKITLSLITIGDVIESLTINNKTYEDKAKEEEEPEGDSEEQVKAADPEEETDEIIVAYRNRSDIGQLFYNLKSQLDAESGETLGMKSVVSGYINSGKIDAVVQDFDKHGEEWYIRLGSFLKWLEDNKMIQSSNKSGNFSPYVKIDYDTDSNLILTNHTKIFPSDPRVCIFQKSFPFNVGGESRSYPFYSKCEPFELETAGQTLGKIMNVYINFRYILTQLDNLTNDEKKVPMLTLVQQILTDVSLTLGGINKLEPFIDDDETILKIIDQTPIPNAEAILKEQGKTVELANFSMYGLRVVNGIQRGSFIKSFNFRTELSKDTAAMTTIGAQANGAPVGEDATAFSKWNEGLIDRISPEKILGKKEKELKDEASKLADREKELSTLFNKMLDGARVLSEDENYPPKWVDDELDTYSSNMRDYVQGKMALYASSAKSVSPKIGFLPVKLSMSMVGLSGMKIYQVFNVDSSFLPSNYPSVLKFLTTGIKHELSDNKWTTSIETLVVPNTIATENVIQTSTNKAASRGAVTTTEPVNQAVVTNAPNVPARGNDSQDAVNALIRATNAVFGNPLSPESHGRCARYTYNLASSYVKALRNKTLPKGADLGAGGNAKDAGYRANLVKLGYTMTDSGVVTKNDLTSLLNSNNFNVGDVVTYWATSGTTSNAKYGHTQIFQKGYITKGYKWMTDNKTNYKSGFVYGRKPQTEYRLFIFKAPK